MISGRGDRSWNTLFAASLASTLLVGLLNIGLPFSGDQALFAQGGRALLDGAVLYGDFWDVKQPGIYMLAAGAGWVVGFGEAAWRLWELVWWLAFAAVIGLGLRRHVEHAAIAALAPVLVVGTYLAGARVIDLGQIEGFVALPLVLAWWCADDSDAAPTSRRWFLFGIAAGAVVLLKHLYIVIPLAFWIHTIVRGGRGKRRAVLRSSLGPVVAGVGLVLVPVAVYFAIHGQLGKIWWTYFVVTPELTKWDPRPFSRLTHGSRHVVTTFSPMILLAGLAVATRWRRSRVVTDLVLWLVVGGLALLVQNWWPYHFLILVTPLLLLGVIGLDELLGRLEGRRLAAVALVLALLCVPLAVDVARKANDLRTHDFALTVDDREAMHLDLDGDYAKARRETAFFHDATARPGAIYVFAHPMYQLMSGRDMAGSYTSWSLDMFPPDLYRRIRDQLAQTRPVYVFVDTFAAQLIEERFPEMNTFFDATYRERSHDDAGTWYELA